MPFELSNVPVTFQATMNQLLKPYLRNCVIVFFDDILIFSSSLQTHLEHLSLILSNLAKEQFNLKFSKCLFSQKYHEGMALDRSKIGPF